MTHSIWLSLKINSTLNSAMHILKHILSGHFYCVIGDHMLLRQDKENHKIGVT